LVIPASVASVGESAFEFCTSLKSVIVEAGDVLDVKDNAFRNNDLDFMKVETKKSVTFAATSLDNSLSLNYIVLRRDLRSILSLPGRFDHYVCSGGACQCKPGSENVLSADSDYFACTTCKPGKFSSMASLGACEVCPMGKYMYQYGAIECDECIAGKYLDKEGMTLASECISCAPGSYGINTGMAACTECPSGSYSTATKATTADTCVECPLNTYAAGGGSSECSACPGGESTNGKEGASACIAPESASLSLKNREDVLKLFTSGMAYMLSILVCIGFAAIGYILMTIRVKNATLCPLPMFIVCGRLAISALSIMSEAFMLAILFSEGTTLFFRLGCIIVLGRVGNIVPTIVVLYSLFGSKSERAVKFKKCFDQDHFLEKVQPYAMLSFLSMWDCSLVALLPWRYSEFADKSRGFPDMLTLRTTSYYKIAQDIARFVCNVFYLLNAQGAGADASVEVMTYFSMAASVATIVLAGMVAVMKNSVLMEVAAKGGTAADSQQLSDSHGDDGARDGDGEGGALELGTIDHYTSNPLHGGDPMDPSTLFRRYPATASVRSLVVQLLPDIDGPSLYGVDKAFQSDGVENMGELKTFLDNGLIGIPELKQYAKQGNLSMVDVMALVTALKPFMAAGGSSDSGSQGAAAAAADNRSNSSDGGALAVDSGAVMSVLQGISEGLEELHMTVSSPIVLGATPVGEEGGDGGEGGDYYYDDGGDDDGGGGGSAKTPLARRQSAKYMHSFSQGARRPSGLGSGPPPTPPGTGEGEGHHLGRRGSYGHQLRQHRRLMAPIPDLLRRTSMATARRASMRSAVKMAAAPSTPAAADGDDEHRPPPPVVTHSHPPSPPHIADVSHSVREAASEGHHGADVPAAAATVDAYTDDADADAWHHDSEYAAEGVCAAAAYNESEAAEYGAHALPHEGEWEGDEHAQYPYESHEHAQYPYESHEHAQYPYESHEHTQYPYESHEHTQYPYESHEHAQYPYESHEHAQYPYENHKHAEAGHGNHANGNESL
jgi:hypothetical protein